MDRMKTFLPGQIRDEYKGDLAAVVSQEGNEDFYRVFSVDFPSDSFTHLTGVYMAGSNVHRVYMGISPDASREITSMVRGQTPETLDPKTIDGHVVISNFLVEPPIEDQTKNLFEGSG